jgi:hypothetical protein
VHTWGLHHQTSGRKVQEQEDEGEKHGACFDIAHALRLGHPGRLHLDEKVGLAAVHTTVPVWLLERVAGDVLRGQGNRRATHEGGKFRGVHSSTPRGLECREKCEGEFGKAVASDKGFTVA